MLRFNQQLTEEPYAMDLLLHLVSTQDFFDARLQRDLLLLVTACNESLSLDRSPWHTSMLERALLANGPHVFTTVTIKEFILSGLDDQVEIQRLLKEQVFLFFQRVRASPNFSEERVYEQMESEMSQFKH